MDRSRHEVQAALKDADWSRQHYGARANDATPVVLADTIEELAGLLREHLGEENELQADVREFGACQCDLCFRTRAALAKVIP